jgi:hypothetical protein
LSNIITWYFATLIHLENRGQFCNNEKAKKRPLHGPLIVKDYKAFVRVGGKKI